MPHETREGARRRARGGEARGRRGPGRGAWRYETAALPLELGRERAADRAET